MKLQRQSKEHMPGVPNLFPETTLKQRWTLVLGAAGLMVAGMALQTFMSPLSATLAEQIGGSPESGVDSRMASAYQSLVTQGHGASPVPEWTENWGARWNRIMSAASWVPDGDVQPNEVLLGKTYYAGDRNVKTGTLDLTDLTFAQTGVYQNTSYSRQFTTNQTTFPPDTSGGWTQLVATGGSPASVTANGATLALASTRVMQDNRTGLIWTDSTTATTFNPFVWTSGELNHETPATRTCNVAATGNANQWCNVSDYTGYDNTGWAGWANPNSVGATGDQPRDTRVSANEMCLNLSADDGSGVKTDWRLPTQRELMIAYLNGSVSQLPNAARNFWAATQHSSVTYSAWYTYLYDGFTYYYSKWDVATRYVRCVRGI